jgi:hypothetical protein
VLYAPAVHAGTRPHTIRPTRKKALYWKGALHPVRLVEHPGTRANPFMTRALDRSRATIAQIVERCGVRIITRRG